MDKKSMYLIYTLVFVILCSLAIVFWKYIIKSDYEVIIPDDPAEFVHET